MKKSLQAPIFSFIIILIFSMFENVKGMDDSPSEDEDFSAHSPLPKKKDIELSLEDDDLGIDPETLSTLRDLEASELLQQQRDMQIVAKKPAKKKEEEYKREEANSKKYTLYSR